MAKGNMFLGMSRGSVGDVTFYRGRGQQLARARNRNPKNPKSSAQMTQRMILATASKAYSRLKPIVNHSFQGVTYGGESQSYFLKRAMERIRNYVAASLDLFPTTITDPEQYVGLAMPNDAHESGIGLLVSQGSIPSIPVAVGTKTIDGESVKYVMGFGSAMSGETATVSQVLAALGASVGDQISIVGLKNGECLVTRYIVKSDASAAELAETWESDGSSAAFDSDKTQIGPCELVYDDSLGYMHPSTSSIDACAVIISRKVGNVWERSTQYLVPMSSEGIGQNVQAIIDMWEIATAAISQESPYYLNNADD